MVEGVPVTTKVPLNADGVTPETTIVWPTAKGIVGCVRYVNVAVPPVADAVLASLCDYADLDGANLIANDLAKGTSIINGKIQLSEKPGLGISLI